MSDGPAIGTIGWLDLTCDNAEAVRDFYAAVTGWTVQDVPMGDYVDYAMCGPDGDGVAGVCHREGPNTDVPTGWMVYVMVADLEASLAAVVAHGGQVLSDRRQDGAGPGFAFVEDPSGAAVALYQAG